jgi:gas vesicle structural protein
MTMPTDVIQYHNLERSASPALADVADMVLNHGLVMVIDGHRRVSLIGLEVATIDSRIIVTSLDAYLRLAQAVERLDR